MSAKSAIMVTGGAGGIGEVCVRHLANIYKVVVVDINEVHAMKIADEVDGVGFKCDITSERSVSACVEAAEKAVGPLVGLVNCAGTVQLQAFAPEEFETSHWDEIQAINTRGTWLVSREVGTRMAKRGKGSMVVIASISGHRAWPTHSYAASKAATISIARGLAVEWGRSGVRVNSLSPGFTLTPKMKEMVEVRNWDISNPANHSAIGRWVEPSEIAKAAAFLISDEASGITGIDLPVDAGWLAGVNWSSFEGVPSAR